MNTFMSALSSGSHTPEGRPASFSTPHMGIQPQQGDADAGSVEGSRKVFLHSWSDYLEAVRRNTESTERQRMLKDYDGVLAEHLSRALGSTISEPLVFGGPKPDYKHVASLIENARSYVTNPKYAAWHSGILDSLPHLEDAYKGLRSIEIPTAEKDIIDAVRTAVNNPFMQVLRCRERTRDLSTALSTSVNGKSYASHLHDIYAEFQTNHRERKVRHALELVKKLEAAVHAAELGYKNKIAAISDAKRDMLANLDPMDPLNIPDYEPPHEQALQTLRAKQAEVRASKGAWLRDIATLKGAVQERDSTFGALEAKAKESSGRHKAARSELEIANEEVKKCWDALMAAQQRASVAEKEYVTSKLQEEMDSQMVRDVASQVEARRLAFEKSAESCDRYCDVLESVERYINGRWEPLKDIVSLDTRAFVTEVCEVYSVSEKAMGDVIDRKQAQVEHAAKEEREFSEKYQRKWEQLDPQADNERARASEARGVKDAASKEVERMSKIRAGMREVLAICRPVMESFGMSVSEVEGRALLEEWDKTRLRTYQEFEDLIEPTMGRVGVSAQSSMDSATMTSRRSAASGASSEEDCRQLCLFLLRVPLLLAIPSECGAPNEGHEKQKMTAQDMLSRTEYLAKELSRHGGLAAAAEVLEPGIKALRDFAGKCSSSAVTETVGSRAGASSHAAGATGMEGTTKV